MKSPIGIFDSGIGGISILNEIKKELPEEDYLFYADSIHNPYGNKSVAELQHIMETIIELFKKEQVKLIVIACNTATTQMISYLRKKYPTLCFVGTEPAIKVAYDYYLKKNTLVMATPGTIHSDRLMELDKKYYQENRILLECNGLAELIEQQKLEKLPNYFKNLFQNIDKEKIEVVVLGCTHYSFIKKEIEKALGHSVIFLDGAKGIARQVKRLRKKEKQEENEKRKGSTTIIITEEKTEEVLKKYLEDKEKLCIIKR